MLEKLSPQARHAIIALLGSATTLGVGYIHSFHFSAPIQAFVGSAVAAILLVVSPLTNQYGVAELNPDGTPKTPAA